MNVVEKLKVKIESLREKEQRFLSDYENGCIDGRNDVLDDLTRFIDTELEKNEPTFIQWRGDNLREVLGFTGVYKRFDEWFSSFEEYEDYVKSHNNIFKIFCENGDHYECLPGTWIIKMPSGYNYPILDLDGKNNQ